MRIISSVAMLLLVLLCGAHSTSTSGTSRSEAKALDALLQDYAYRALVNPITGDIYDGVVPSNLTGIKIAALRLRSGSLTRRGVKMYKEFEIPKGLVGIPYMERLVLVYQNLGNWSPTFYELPNYTYLAPVLGLLAYNGSNLSATNLPELDINVSGDPISVKFEDVKSAPDGAVAKCIQFDLQGSSNFSNVTRGNTCSTSQQGHFSIVVESTTPPALAPAPASAAAPSAHVRRKGKRQVLLIVGYVLLAVALLLMVALCFWLRNYLQTKRSIQGMERAANVGEPFRIAPVGTTRLPAAIFTRTLPVLEEDTFLE